MSDALLTFPDDYATSLDIYVPINASLLPYVAGALNNFVDSSLWATETDYQSAHNAIAQLQVNLGSFMQVQQSEVLIGPSSGNGNASWRRLVAVDLPQLSYASLANIPATFVPIAHAIQHSSGGNDAITPASIGASATNHTHIIDYGSLSNIPASFNPTAHASRHASGGNDVLSYSSLSGIPASFTPSAHASRHAVGGNDVLTPAAIGAATSGHTHSINWIDILSKPNIFSAVDAPFSATGWNNVTKNTGTYILNANTLFGTPLGATAIVLRVSATWATAGANLTVRPYQAATGVIALACQVANVANHVSGIVALNSNQFEIQIFTANCTNIFIAIAGYWF